MILSKPEVLGLLVDTAGNSTADHGLYFGEHGRIGKSAVRGEPWPLYEEICHAAPALLGAEESEVAQWQVQRWTGARGPS